MWKKNKNLKNELLKYFYLFSILILGMLWAFQFIFFDTLYKNQKINDIKVVAKNIKENQNSESFYDTINNLAFDKSVCVEIENSDYDLLYSSSYFGKGCISSIQTTYKYKSDFINNNKKEETYTLTNERFDTETIVYATKLNNNQYAFINASLEPVDGTVNLIQKQLLIITLLVIIFSYIIANIISSYISKPINDINNEAKKLAKGNFDIEFREDNQILEIEELSRTLNYTRDELSKTEELRRDLMANVSHDLKTPLTMIKANAEICKDLHMNNPKKQEEDMNTIISETDRLTILVNDILELSKMESVTEELQLEEFDLIKLINNIIKKYKVLQEVENYTFNFIHDEDSIMIKADKKRLQQVIYNLINNAINYTGDDNLVTIKVSRKSNILVEIIDTGKGIKKEDIPYIWDKYYKNKKKHKRNLIGTGLGLSIVKKILESHNFTYGVKSKENKGTTFYFEIPNK